MYKFESRVRFSEVDANGILKWSSLVNYLQDCSTFHSEDLGIGVEYCLSRGNAWVLNYWQIDVDRLPKLADNIIIGTIPYEIRGFMGKRNYYIKDSSTDEIIVKANSIWTYINLDKVLPVRVDQIMAEKYGTGAKLDMEYTDRKINFSGDFSVGDEIIVQPHMLDTNHHVNNQQYIELTLPYVKEDVVIRRLRTEYRESAYLGDILVPTIYESPNSVGISLTKKGANAPCVNLLFEW